MFAEIRSTDLKAVESQRRAYEQLIFPRANQLSVCAALVGDPEAHASVVVEVTFMGRVDKEYVRGVAMTDALRTCLTSVIHRWVFPSGPQAVILELPIQDCPSQPDEGLRR